MKNPTDDPRPDDLDGPKGEDLITFMARRLYANLPEEVRAQIPTIDERIACRARGEEGEGRPIPETEMAILEENFTSTLQASLSSPEDRIFVLLQASLAKHTWVSETLETADPVHAEFHDRLADAMRVAIESGCPKLARHAAMVSTVEGMIGTGRGADVANLLIADCKRALGEPMPQDMADYLRAVAYRSHPDRFIGNPEAN